MISQEGSSLLKSCARRSFSFTSGNLQAFATHPHSLGDPWFEKHWFSFTTKSNLEVSRGVLKLRYYKLIKEIKEILFE